MNRQTINYVRFVFLPKNSASVLQLEGPDHVEMGSGEGVVPPPQKIFGLLLLKWCILSPSENLH